MCAASAPLTPTRDTSTTEPQRPTAATTRFSSRTTSQPRPEECAAVRCHHVLAAKGVVFGTKFGWERPNYYALENQRISEPKPAGWQREGEDHTIGREHRAARQATVMIDMSSFTKLEITGAGSVEFLQHMAVANVNRDPGRAAYTQLCNEQGGIEADVTIIRRSEERFWMITGSALGVRDGAWLRSHVKAHGRVEIRDVTSSHGVINLAGPLARDVLERVTDADVSHEGHPFLTAAEINIGYAPALAFRVTYIGELGWELYIPVEYMHYAYEVLAEAGAEFAITDIGYRAVDSLRLEKRYLAWGADITPDYNPIEAGLGFVIDWEKDDFLGAEALAQVTREGPVQRLVYLGLDDPLPVFGGEAIFVDGEPAGQTTSGNFGYTVGKSLVLGYVPSEMATADTFAVESFGTRTPAARIRGAAYDPERANILR